MKRTAGDVQVLIYFDKPEGQVLQVSFDNYYAYWRLLGWKILGPATHLPGIDPHRDKSEVRMF